MRPLRTRWGGKLLNLRLQPKRKLVLWERRQSAVWTPSIQIKNTLRTSSLKILQPQTAVPTLPQVPTYRPTTHKR
jgi:hypothetical protein